MINLNLRPATINDAPFLAQTIIEAEKSGTDKLSYSTIFGFSEKMTYKFSVMKLDEHGEYSETIGTTNSFEEMLKMVKKGEK